MTVKVQFLEPYLTDKSKDGKTVIFPINVIEPGEGARLDQVAEHEIKVAIVGTRASIWGFERREDPKLMPTLFEYAYPVLVDRLLTDRLDDAETIFTSDEKQYPFKPEELTDPTGRVYGIDLESERLQRKLQRQSQIGFHTN